MKTKTVIFGASGLIGQSLLPRLQGMIIALSKSKIMDDSQNVQWFSSDLLIQNKEFPKELIYGAETAYHLARDIDKNLELSENIISLLETSKIKRLILVSLSGAEIGSSRPLHHEKYLIEQLAINSMIPEVIVVRAPILVAKNQQSVFDKYVAGHMGLPLIYPVLWHKKDCPLLLAEDLGIYLEKLKDIDSIDPRNIVDLATSRFKMKKIFLRTMRSASEKKKLALGSFIGNWVGGLIDLLRKDRDDRKKFRKFLKSMIEVIPEKEMPPGFPEPKTYDALEDVYQS